MKKDFSVELDFHCYSCDNEFTIIAEEAPILCPFCGLDLDNENIEEQEDDDTYIDYADDDED